jgi:hypothetical protein
VTAVTAQDKPCAPQHRHAPDNRRKPRIQRRGTSFSTYSGTEDRLSVTLSTSTRTSIRSAVASFGMLFSDQTRP